MYYISVCDNLGPVLTTTIVVDGVGGVEYSKASSPHISYILSNILQTLFMGGGEQGETRKKLCKRHSLKW